jgi:hypothetical protein
MFSLLKKKRFRLTIALLVVAAIVAHAAFGLNKSKEFHAARSIAQEYATQNNLGSDLTCVSGHKSWTKRGDYNLSCFLFLPKGTNSTRLILVRYTATCPLNTFEAGMVTNSGARNCTADTAISNSKFISPP